MTRKPEEQIVDIDAADANNELAAVEYVEDMYKFYKLLEVLIILTHKCKKFLKFI